METPDSVFKTLIAPTAAKVRLERKCTRSQSGNIFYLRPIDMLKNHLKVAIRNMLRRKGFTVFNILGLAIGIACCMLIFQYVAYEKSYDGFHEHASKIVRLRLDFHDQGKLTMQSATVYPGLGALLKKELPEVENYCRLIDTRISFLKNEMVQNNIVLANDERNVKALENTGYYAALINPVKSLRTE